MERWRDRGVIETETETESSPMSAGCCARILDRRSQPLLEDLQRPSAVDKQVDHGWGWTSVARPPVRR